MFVVGLVIGFLAGLGLGLIYGSKNAASVEADLSQTAAAAKAEAKKL